MNCSKCGHELTGNVKFCPKCGTPVEETPVVEEAPVAEETPAVEASAEESASLFGEKNEPLFEKNEGSIFEETSASQEDVLGDAPTEELVQEDASAQASEPAQAAEPAMEQQPAYEYATSDYTPEAPKKKFNKIWLIVIGAVILVGAIVAIIFCNFRAAFASPKSLMKNALVGYTEDSLDKYEDQYNSRIDALKDNGNQQVVDATVTLDDGFRDLLDAYNVDADWLESTHIKMEVNAEDDSNIGANIYAGVNGVDIFSLLYLAQIEDEMFYMQIPELSDEYIGVDLAELSDSDFGGTFSNFDSISKVEKISNEDVKKLSTKYIKIIIGELEKVTKEKEELEVEGVSAKYYKLTATVDEETRSAINVAVDKAILKDEDLKDILKIYHEYYGTNEQLAEMYGISSTDFDEWYDELMEKVQENLDEEEEKLEGYKKNKDGDKEIFDLVVYVNRKGDLKGLEINKLEDKGEMYIHYPEDGDDFGMEMGFYDGDTNVVITGAGTNSHDVINGDFTVKSDDKEVLEIEVIDYDEGSSKDGGVNGEFIVRAGEDAGEGTDMASQMLASLEYDFVFDSSDDNSTCKITVKNDTVSFATINIESTYDDVETISEPSDYLDITNTSDVGEYAKSMSLSTLISNLKEAGVPEKYTSQLEYFEQMLSYGY